MNKQHMTLSLSVGVLGGISVFLAGNVLAPLSYSIWVGFIGWAMFFKNGGDNDSLKMTCTAGIYGAVVAGIFFALSGAMPIGGALNVPIWIAITVFGLMMGTQVSCFACAPTAVTGYAACAGYVLHASAAPMVSSMALLQNPVVIVSLSLVIGAIFGMISGKVAAAAS